MDREGIRLAQGIENTLDQVRRLVGSQLATYSATNITIMNTISPVPPAVCYNLADNLYYLRYRGAFGGTLDPTMQGVEDATLRGVIQNRDADFWLPITSEKWLYTVRNKTELDQLIVAPPALAFRQDTHRYYYRVGPEGYGGHTGLSQLLDLNGNPQWDNGPAITANVLVPGPNTWNTLYTTWTTPVAGTQFTVEGIVDPDTLLTITFQITQVLTVGSLRLWAYLPEFNSADMIGKKITAASYSPAFGTVSSPPPAPTVDYCYVSNLSGTVLLGHTFKTDATGNTVFTITEIEDTKWTYNPSAEQFPNGTKITMTHAGNPKMEIRDPDAWILNSHLYEDNTQGFI